MKLRPLTVAAMLVAAAALAFDFSHGAPPAPPSAAAPPSRTPKEFRRAPDNTYLTYPEWFLVWSPREYAQFVQSHPPSGFPFLGHVGQFWQGYSYVYAETKNARPFNFDYHSMIWVIGASMALENVLTRGFESFTGRAGEALTFHGPTAEDQLAARVAADYAAFLDAEPFYKFDFATPLRQLWTDTGLWGPDPLRKWERKYFLTTQYAFKVGYLWFIKRSSESAYGIEATTTIVVLDHAPAPNSPLAPKTLTQFPDGAALVELPRYQAFMPAAVSLAKSGFRFLEIAGNQGPILITAIVPSNFHDDTLRPLFTQPIITHPGRMRIAFTVPVHDLSAALMQLQSGGIELEHIYDY